MDPTTTLITFMFCSPKSTQSIDLVGSWDNFSKRYAMERDIRRGHGQWRGVHSFKDISCDGDRPISPKRNGGLKMGHTYWYYYELNDGTETHDAALPSTTSCPYLPGQPVNLLHVPVQVNPLRERSASEGAMSQGSQTMNPKDKFLAPRAPPAPPAISRPQLARLNTAPSLSIRNASLRSESPNGPRSPWSPRSLFGLRAAISAVSDNRERGRGESPVTRDFRDLKSSGVGSPADARPSMSVPTSAAPPNLNSRNTSPHSIRKVRSREPSPLRNIVNPQTVLHHPTPLAIADEIAEEDFEDDDANFASPGDNHYERGMTILSPPPTSRTPPPPFSSSRPVDSKPLPKLPVDDSSPILPTADSPSLIPAPLYLALPDHLKPRSHFSLDTISTGVVSPTESHFSVGGESFDDDVGDESFAEEVELSTAMTGTKMSRGISGTTVGMTREFAYTLPEGEFGSELTLRKEMFGVLGEEDVKVGAVRNTFGPRAFAAREEQGVKMAVGDDGDTMSALDELLAEMGYLGGVIVGK